MRLANLMLILAVLLISAIHPSAAAAAAAAAPKNSAGFSTAVMSNYVWRGINLSDTWVVQPSMDFAMDSLSANFWANYDGDTGEANETDFTLAYRYGIDKLILDVGYIYYALDGAEDTQEVFASATYDLAVSPSLTVYYDYDEGTGGFAVLALEYTKETGRGMMLGLGASASYLFENAVVGVDAAGEQYSALHNGEVSASLSVSVNDALSIEPMVAYSFPLSADARDAMKAYSFDGDESVFYGGVTASLGF